MHRPSVWFLAPLAALGCLTVPKKESGDETKKSLSSASFARELGTPGEVSSTATVTADELRARVRARGRKATLVNAWASWCGPCREEYPALEKLRGELDGRGVDLVFVSVDDDESLPKAVRFAAEYGSPTPVLAAPHPLGDFKQGMYEGWPGMLPASFLLDSEGTLRHFWGGPITREDLEPILTKFLAGGAIPLETNFGLIPGRDLHGE